MATAPLDGIRIEVPHSSSPDEISQQLLDFAKDLAENRFSSWGVQVQQSAGHIDLIGDHNGTRFQAKVIAEETRVVLTIDGQVQISRIKLTLAGGPSGLRRRVSDEIQKVLRAHVGG